MTTLEMRIEAEYVFQMNDRLEASRDYGAALPRDMRLAYWRRSLRSFSFFNNPHLFDDERSFEFMYRERYRMHANPILNAIP